MEPTPIDADDDVGIGKEDSKLFKCFYVLIFRVGHIYGEGWR